jgi:predicted HTH domain antitoxin
MDKRQSIIELLRRGIITQSEAATLANVTRQAIKMQCLREKIDAQGARKSYLAKLLARLDEKRAPAK